MRVVSGIAGGIPLLAPKTDLRPTMDRVKGAIFDSLGEWVIGRRVLDLFSGSGALGIEALSRGAAHATLVEKEVRAVETIERNLSKTGLKEGAAVHRLDAFSFLHRLAPAGGYDLIVADPPYEKRPGERDFGSELLGDPAVLAALAPDGWLILEKRPVLRWKVPPVWEPVKERRYGATAVAWFRKREGEAASPEE
ncbi:MAG TPA: RsmD family RNA methyltransferase [Chthoniobacteraceae bacterium]|nr:RsmD family RNA methyltransferase [Chthoniobacteraceae bacterium]